MKRHAPEEPEEPEPPLYAKLGPVTFVDRERGVAVTLTLDEFLGAIGCTPQMFNLIRENVRWSDEEVDLNP